MTNDDDEVMLCLHACENEGFPSMNDKETKAGNGVLFYFRRKEWEEIRYRLDNLCWTIDKDIHLNTNSNRHEFSFRDPDGYHLTVSEYHAYEG